MYDDMIKLGMDGIVFYPIGQNPYDVGCEIYCEHTVEQFKTVKGYPRSNWAYYKLINKDRIYFDCNGDYIKDLTKVESVAQQLKVKITTKAVRAELSCLNCVLDHDVYFDKEAKGDIRFLDMGTVVLGEAKCEQCGCNSFNVKLFYAVVVD